MAKKIVFSDRVAQYPSRYSVGDLGGGLYSIEASPGTISTEGTAISASNLNAMADEVIFKLKDTSSSTTTYTTSLTGLSTYYEGLTILFKPTNTNTGASTINISGIGAVSIKKTNNSGNIVDLVINDLIKNKYYTMTYDGTEFLMNNPSADLAQVISDIQNIEDRLDIDESNVASITNETVKFAVLTGSNNAYGASISTVGSLYSGLVVNIVPNVTNTGACTLQINSLTAKNIKWDSSDLTSGMLQINKLYTLIYDGIVFNLQPSASLVAGHLSQDATETQKGHMQLATAAEVTAGTNQTKAVTPKNLKTELDKKLNIDNYNPHDVDNGRYQSNFGLDDAVLTGCTLDSNNNVTLTGLTTIQQTQKNSYISTYSANGIGQNLTATFCQNMKSISIIKVLVYSVQSSPTYNMICKLYDVTSATELGSATFNLTGIQANSYMVFNFGTSITVPQNHVLQIRLIAATFDSSNFVTVAINTTDVQSNANLIQTADSWSSYTSQTSQDLAYDIIYTTNFTTGTATKTYVPTDIKKYGNVKVTVANINANNSATVTVKSSADVQLKAPVTLVNGDNYIDISDINSSTYPSLKVVFTLNRNSVEDSSPTVSDVSVTWEGKNTNFFQDRFVIDITSPVSQVDFDLTKLVGKYRYFNLIGSVFSTGNTSSYDTLMINFNDDLNSNYDYGGTSGKSYIGVDSLLPHSNLNNIGTVDIKIIDNLNKYKNVFGNYIQTGAGAAMGGHWRNTSSNISKISLKASTNSFGIGSQFTLIGVK